MRKLSREEFDYLSLLAEGKEQEKTIPASLDNDCVNNGAITAKGLSLLEPYRAKRAIFLAAGLGSRMHPITVNIPKPMVKVHGKRIIETSLEAVIAAGIQEIYIIRGYLGETFDLLLKKYPMIKFIENEEYIGTGTIASVFRARNLLSNAYVIESDIVINDPSVIKKYHYRSDYMGASVTETDDWYLKTDDEGKIIDIGVNSSGENLYKLAGISYWDSEAGEKLKIDLENAYSAENGKKLSWSKIPFILNKEHYCAEIMPCQLNDVTEIDSFKELQEYDSTYCC